MNNVHPIFQQALAPFAPPRLAPPRFAVTYCSQCGAEFGPGQHGYSHCGDHDHEAEAAAIAADIANNKDKAERAHAEQERNAMRLQLQYQNEE